MAVLSTVVKIVKFQSCLHSTSRKNTPNASTQNAKPIYPQTKDALSEDKCIIGLESRILLRFKHPFMDFAKIKLTRIPDLSLSRSKIIKILHYRSFMHLKKLKKQKLSLKTKNWCFKIFNKWRPNLNHSVKITQKIKTMKTPQIPILRVNTLI